MYTFNKDKSVFKDTLKTTAQNFAVGLNFEKK